MAARMSTESDRLLCSVLSISRITSRSGFVGTARRDPFEEVPERRPAVAAFRLFFRGQLGKCFLDLRKVEQRIVAEAIRAPRSVEDDSFGRAPKCGQTLTVTRGSQHTDKSCCALIRGSALQFAQNARIVRVVVGICVRLMRLLILQIGGGVAGGMDARS